MVGESGLLHARIIHMDSVFPVFIFCEVFSFFLKLFPLCNLFSEPQCACIYSASLRVIRFLNLNMPPYGFSRSKQGETKGKQNCKNVVFCFFPDVQQRSTLFVSLRGDERSTSMIQTSSAANCDAVVTLGLIRCIRASVWPS